MNKIEQLAREATDLGRPNATIGQVDIGSGSAGWNISVFVHNPFAFGHADQQFEANEFTPEFWTMRESGTDLDEVLDRMIVRVRDAVADTPAQQVA